jgi:ribosomal protein S18 acetylase RimI-like enzyme
VLYRLYQPDDFAALYAIEELCFHPPHRFSRATMRRLIRQPHAATWIAEENAAMRGFAIVEWALDTAPPSAYIETIEVVAQARGQGVGEELMRRVEASACAAGAAVIWLHVDALNEQAIRLYQRSGYQPHGTRADYYGPGTEALIYGKILARSA